MAGLASESAETEYAFVQFYQCPCEIRAKADIAKNALRLHPITDLNKIVATDKGADIVAESKSFTFKVEPPPKFRMVDLDKNVCVNLASGFWYVKLTDDPDEANVRLSKTKVGKITIPYYFNPRGIKKNEKICVLQSETDGASKRARR